MKEKRTKHIKFMVQFINHLIWSSFFVIQFGSVYGYNSVNHIFAHPYIEHRWCDETNLMKKKRMKHTKVMRKGRRKGSRMNVTEVGEKRNGG